MLINKIQCFKTYTKHFILVNLVPHRVFLLVKFKFQKEIMSEIIIQYSIEQKHLTILKNNFHDKFKNLISFRLQNTDFFFKLLKSLTFKPKIALCINYLKSKCNAFHNKFSVA